ncbi:hypothetical protein ZIOFF_020846 [Zingiber officinale]|uniref:S1-like domain-containing protein n=1 Tax=Zingiber officinale TaxID=94328 RepID=A0A8J5H675_ZINOF|nr:hypothetical protein ZIOFF_020846 [Zingiber officinale]
MGTKREHVGKHQWAMYTSARSFIGGKRSSQRGLDAVGIRDVARVMRRQIVMHKKVWIAAEDIILVGLRDYQDDKADIIFKYMLDEVRLLKAYGELPENIRLNEGIRGLDEEDEGGADDYIEFEDEDIDKI